MALLTCCWVGYPIHLSMSTSTTLVILSACLTWVNHKNGAFVVFVEIGPKWVKNGVFGPDWHGKNEP